MMGADMAKRKRKESGARRTSVAVAVVSAQDGNGGGIESNSQRAAIIAKGVTEEFGRLAKTPLGQRDGAKRLKQRVSLIYPADHFGLERVIGERDILQIT